MIIVTGDADFIGSNIVKALNDKGITGILVVDDPGDGTKFVNLVNLDIADHMDEENFLIQVMVSKKFDDVEAILREDACSSITEWDDKYVMDSNYQCSRELLHYCLGREIPFLYASSTVAYGGRTSDFIESREYEKPLDVYGYSKFLFDECVRRILPEANSQIVGFRYFNVYGPREGRKGSMAGVVFHLSTQLNNGESPKLFEGSENFKRDFVCVGDVTNANLQSLENGISGIFNLDADRVESFQAVADATLAYHKKGQIEYIPFPDKLKGRYQAFTQADLTNLYAAGCDKPFKTVTEGITEYMVWLNRDAQELCVEVLVISPSQAGDMMMSQSLHHTFQARYPQVIIDVMTPAWCRPLLPRISGVNEAIPMSLDHGALEIDERRKLSRSLREKRYDRTYILPNSFKSALVPFFAGIPRRTGWRGEMCYSLLNDVRVLDKETRPLMVEHYIALAYGKDATRTTQDLPQLLLWPQLQVSESEKSYTCNQFSLSSERPLIGFCSGAEFDPTKRWPHYHYTELTKQLTDEGYQVVLFGSAKDYEAGNKTLAALSIEQQAWCRNLAGEAQLDQAAILIAACKAVVTSDSGLMHVAAVLNHPLAALYGPSSPGFTPPLSHKVRAIRLITGYHKVRKGDAVEGCHQSLIDITPQRVLEELNALLLQEKA